MMDHGAVKNLEQIQEQDESTRMPRALSLALVGLGGACIAFAVLAIGGRKTSTNEKRPDPLGDLVAQHKTAPAGASLGTPAASLTQLSAKDVTFPQILSDGAKPTTALAAVRTPAPPSTAIPPTPAGDQLTVVRFSGGTPPIPHDDSEHPLVRADAPSLPAQNVLEATPIVTRPRDPLTKSASDAAQIGSAAAATSPSGHEGGYQLQVSSFKTQGEATQFADQLRARGHKSYTEEARVPGRGVWWRVRIGPFATKNAAIAYRASFEQKEHVVPFIVTPKGKDGTASHD